MAEKITSAKNERIKRVVKLQEKASERKSTGTFIVEGLREISLALDNHYQPTQVFVCAESGGLASIQSLGLPAKTSVFETSKEAFAKLAYRENRDGLVAVMQAKTHHLDSLTLPKKPLIIVLESVEKPGNLGAVLRTADAAAVHAVIVCDPATDIYNPNVIRSGIGCSFAVQIAIADTSEAIAYLKQKRIKTFAAALSASNRYDQVNYCEPSAIVMGTEANGLSQTWLDEADEHIIIPMLGQHDSLNVSTSTAVIVFEAMRQRGF